MKTTLFHSTSPKQRNEAFFINCYIYREEIAQGPSFPHKIQVPGPMVPDITPINP